MNVGQCQTDLVAEITKEVDHIVRGDEGVGQHVISFGQRGGHHPGGGCARVHQQFSLVCGLVITWPHSSSNQDNLGISTVSSVRGERCEATHQFSHGVPVAGTAVADPGVDEVRQVGHLPRLVVSPHQPGGFSLNLASNQDQGIVFRVRHNAGFPEMVMKPTEYDTGQCTHSGLG